MTRRSHARVNQAPGPLSRAKGGKGPFTPGKPWVMLRGLDRAGRVC